MASKRVVLRREGMLCTGCVPTFEVIIEQFFDFTDEGFLFQPLHITLKGAINKVTNQAIA